MKFVRTIVIILFILAAAAFGISKAVELKNRDTSIPEITSDREVLEIPCDYTEEQLMEGLTACDAKDGDLTAEIVAGNFSRFLSPGLCDLTYVVFDSSNQPGSLTRRVRFTDYHSPDFTLTDPLVFEESEGSYTTVMDQIGASDMLEGDLSDWVIQTDSDANYQKSGDYHVQMEVTNSYGDTSSLSLPVHVVKSGSQSMEIVLSSWIVYLDPGSEIRPADYVTALYNGNGESIGAEAVSWESGVDTQTPGVYEIHYTASDGQGHSGETWMTVVVREQEEQP